MTISFRSRYSTLTLAALIVAATPFAASAQSRPFRGLFGTNQDPSRYQTLTFTLSTYGGWDDNVLGGQPGAGSNPTARVEGTIVGGSAGLAYTRNTRRLSISSNINTSARYYPDRDTLSAGSYGAMVGASYAFSPRSRLSVAQNVGYQPYYQLGLFPSLPGLEDVPIVDDPIPSNLDFAVVRRSSWISHTSVNFERKLGRRSTLNMIYGLQHQNFEQNTADIGTLSDVTAHSGGFAFRRQLTPDVGLRLGYRYRSGDYSGTRNRRVESHNLDIGADYRKALPLSRRTTLSFATGSTIMQADDRRFYQILGNATLAHEFSDTWQGSLTYSRDLGFVGAFDEPFFSDSVRAGLNGFIGRRLNLFVNGGYLTGIVGLDDDDRDRGFRTTYGAAGLQYALTSYLAFDLQYSYYQYNFGVDVTLPEGLNRRFERNGVRAGLSLSLPLIR